MDEKELQKRLEEIFKRASDEATQKAEEYFKKFEKRDKEMLAKVSSGELSKEKYDLWKKNQILAGERWNSLVDNLSDELTKADQTAREEINRALPSFLAEGMNRALYEAETLGQLAGSFGLIDRNAAIYLAKNKPQLLPSLDPESETARKIREGKIKRWNQQHITSEVTQGVVLGESMSKVAKRLRNVAEMDKNAAMRNARTATGAAVNAGKLEGMRRDEEKGVPTEKMWVSILDSKTRHEHRSLDGQIKKLDEPFESREGYQLMYPRDPNADACMIYNCRCRIVSVPSKIKDMIQDMYDREGNVINTYDADGNVVKAQSYDEWKNEKQKKTGNKTTYKKKDTHEAVVQPKEDLQKPQDFISETNAPVPDRFADKLPDIEQMTGKDIKKIFIDDDSYVYSKEYVEMQDERTSLFDKQKQTSAQINSLEKELKSESTVLPRDQWSEEDVLYYQIMGDKPTNYTDRGHEIQDELRDLRSERRDIDHRITELNDDIHRKDRIAYFEEAREWESKDHPFTKGEIGKEYQGFTTTMSIGQFDEDLKNGIGFIAEMSPDEYLDRIAMDIFHTSYERAINCDWNNVKKYARMMADGTKFDMGYLNYAEEKQEGRHRAIAARLLGIKKIPVYIRGR